MSKTDFNDESADDKDYTSGAYSDEKFSNEVKPGKISRRSKRQAEFGEIIPDQGADDIQNIWQSMMTTVVDGAKQIVKKIAEGIDAEPGAAYAKWKLLKLRNKIVHLFLSR